EESRRRLRNRGGERNIIRREQVERFTFQSGDLSSYLILPHPEQFLIHLGFGLESLVDNQALRNRLLPQAVAGFAQAAQVTPQRIDLIEQPGVDRLGKAALGLDRVGNAERTDKRIEPRSLRNIDDQFAQTKKRIAFGGGHEIDASRLAKRDGVHSVNDIPHHLGQVARDKQI